MSRLCCERSLTAYWTVFTKNNFCSTAPHFHQCPDVGVIQWWLFSSIHSWSVQPAVYQLRHVHQFPAGTGALMVSGRPFSLISGKHFGSMQDTCVHCVQMCPAWIQNVSWCVQYTPWILSITVSRLTLRSWTHLLFWANVLLLLALSEDFSAFC